MLGFDSKLEAEDYAANHALVKMIGVRIQQTDTTADCYELVVDVECGRLIPTWSECKRRVTTPSATTRDETDRYDMLHAYSAYVGDVERLHAL